MRFLIIFIFLIYCAPANAVTDIKNIFINKELKKYEELTFLDDDKNQVYLRDYNGKLILLNFWATWCAPCKKEMPSLERLTFKYPQIKVYAVNTEKPSKIRTRDFFRSVGVTTLNTYYDPQLNLVKVFKLRGLPTSILIDKEGKEFGRVIGEIDFASDFFSNLMEKYL